MITSYCIGCGAGPMDLPGNQTCEDCHAEDQAAEPELRDTSDEHDYDNEWLSGMYGFSYNGEDW